MLLKKKTPQIAADELVSYCNMNFFKPQAETILTVIIGSVIEKRLAWRVSPHDLCSLEKKEFENVVLLLSHFRNSENSIEAMFDREWLNKKVSLFV